MLAPELAAGLSLSLGKTLREAGGDRLLLLMTRLLLLPPAAATVAMDRVELFRDAAADPPAFFLDLGPPPAPFGPDPLFLFLMTSVFRLRGRTTPWSLRKSPHALQSG